MPRSMFGISLPGIVSLVWPHSVALKLSAAESQAASLRRRAFPASKYPPPPRCVRDVREHDTAWSPAVSLVTRTSLQTCRWRCGWYAQSHCSANTREKEVKSKCRQVNSQQFESHHQAVYIFIVTFLPSCFEFPALDCLGMFFFFPFFLNSREFHKHRGYEVILLVIFFSCEFLADEHLTLSKH